MEKNSTDSKDNSDLFSDLKSEIIHTLSPYHAQTEGWQRKEVECKADELIKVFKKWFTIKTSP